MVFYWQTSTYSRINRNLPLLTQETHMTRTATIVIFLLFISISSFADSPQLQQMKDMIKQMEKSGNVPPSLYKMVKDLEELEKENGPADLSSLKVEEEDCTDDLLAGVWYANNGLTKLELLDGGQAVLKNDDVTGQYETDARFKWSSSSAGFTADYSKSKGGYVRVIEKRTGKAPVGSNEYRYPKTDTVRCRYMGNMLDIGYTIYNR